MSLYNYLSEKTDFSTLKTLNIQLFMPNKLTIEEKHNKKNIEVLDLTQKENFLFYFIIYFSFRELILNGFKNSKYLCIKL